MQLQNRLFFSDRRISIIFFSPLHPQPLDQLGAGYSPGDQLGFLAEEISSIGVFRVRMQMPVVTIGKYIFT